MYFLHSFAPSNVRSSPFKAVSLSPISILTNIKQMSNNKEHVLINKKFNEKVQKQEKCEN